MFCKQCGAQVADDAIFCENCGASLKEQTAAPVVGEMAGATSAEAETAPVEAAATPAAAEADIVTAEAEAEVVVPTVAEAMASASESGESLQAPCGDFAPAPDDHPNQQVSATPEGVAANGFGTTPEGAAANGFGTAPEGAAANDVAQAPGVAAPGTVDTFAATGATDGFVAAPGTGGTFVATDATDGFAQAPAGQQPVGGFAASGQAPLPGQAPVPGQAPIPGQPPIGGPTPYAGGTMEPPKKKSKKGLIIGLSIALVAIIIAAVIVGVRLGKSYEVDLTKGLQVDYIGYNGEGEADVDLDEDAISDALTEQGMSEDDADDFVEDMTIEVDPGSGFSNGDEISVKVIYDKSQAETLKITVTNEKVTYTVSGLEDKPATPSGGNDKGHGKAITEKELIGTWDATKFSYGGTEMSPDDADMDFRIEFVEGGILKAFTNDEADGQGRWSIKDGVISMTSGGNEMDYNWDGTNLAITLDKEQDFIVTLKKR